MSRSKSKGKNAPKAPESYKHPESDSLMRPDVGTQPQFKKRKPPQVYHYDSSLSPALDWDSQNPAREQGEALIREILEAGSIEQAKASAAKLKAMSRPFMNWAGKAERLSFEVPTLPLFVHERLSTKAILETLKGHKRDTQMDLFDLFSDPLHSVTDQVLRAYEHRDKWVNRMVLGDSLVVMNSLLHYEGLGGQVQVIYMDPPYGVKFGSNFQPFVRKRDVKHNEDEDMTREPEMVQAYRDTWELGLHSYLTYLRDRLLIARELLTATGSVFVQISDENLHHVREVMDEVFGGDQFLSTVTFAKTTGFSGSRLSSVADFILWYAKDINLVKYRPLFRPKEAGDEGATKYRPVETIAAIPRETFTPGRLATSADLTAQGALADGPEDFEFAGKKWKPPSGLHWKTTIQGLTELARAGRIIVEGNSLRFVRFLDDFPVFPISNIWSDIGGVQNRTEGKLYVVQTAPLAIQRCLLMTTDPGDLVLDPTCGSGTTAYVAEQWGRRWITIDTSRVPLALARQRLLSATYPYYELKDGARGPAGGFVYRRRQNSRGEEIGGIVPHVTLKAIANNESGAEEVLVDRPEIGSSITRVSGPFCFEATIPTPVNISADGAAVISDDGTQTTSFTDRWIEVLRKSPVIRLEGNRSVTLKNLRVPTRSMSLSAEATVDASAPGQSPSLQDVVMESAEKNIGMLPLTQKPVAIVFGPENGAVSEGLVYQAAKEACAKDYTHLYVIGFAIQPNARQLVDNCADVIGIPATYVQATPDLIMGDLLKNMRSSQIFSVCGSPDIHIHESKENGSRIFQVELLGVDVFDPVTMEVYRKNGDDVPAWFLDTDYNDLCFHVCQAFFPRTSAWDNLKRSLKGVYEDSVWDHLAGATSEKFEAGEHRKIAVKVIDDRGNELMVVEELKVK
jgi:adenine-specific DNA-methyltransferase